MKIEEYNKFYHVDISTQINNKWKDNTFLAIVKDSRRYSIMIKGRDKEELKKRFLVDETEWYNKIHNKKVIALIYSYLLYKALCEFQEAKPLLLCRDVRPEKFVMNYFQKITAFFKNYNISERTVKFRKRVEFETRDKLPKSLAGKYARKVYQGRLPAIKTLNSEEIHELNNLISKLL